MEMCYENRQVMTTDIHDLSCDRRISVTPVKLNLPIVHALHCAPTGILSSCPRSASRPRFIRASEVSDLIIHETLTEALVSQSYN